MTYKLTEDQLKQFINQFEVKAESILLKIISKNKVRVIINGVNIFDVNKILVESYINNN